MYKLKIIPLFRLTAIWNDFSAVFTTLIREIECESKSNDE